MNPLTVMPTPLDHVMKSKNAVLAFSGLVTAAVAWSFWGGDMFPANAQTDPIGDPATWTREELRRWLAARNLYPDPRDTDKQLLERVQANMR
ncbi:hypothetical protein F4808DRAFT_447233 [Astrocystis sublimbata]|nr:hypothetical protein F4808DRAFT_447221 [Astrocystis sublimbata]KAI0186818.1 hypothetical protein F4808DRAFT_447233 [Astrocystis sublimbata]